MTHDIIDGYCHCGHRKYRPIEDVRRVMDRFGVSRAVLVQHLGEYDNSYLQQIVAAEPDRFAGVFLINVEDAAATDHLARWVETKVFRGIRLLAHTLLMKEEAVYLVELDLLRSGKLGVPWEVANQALSKTAMNLWFDKTKTDERTRHGD